MSTYTEHRERLKTQAGPQGRKTGARVVTDEKRKFAARSHTNSRRRKAGPAGEIGSCRRQKRPAGPELKSSDLHSGPHPLFSSVCRSLPGRIAKIEYLFSTQTTSEIHFWLSECRSFGFAAFLLRKRCRPPDEYLSNLLQPLHFGRNQDLETRVCVPQFSGECIPSYFKANNALPAINVIVTRIMQTTAIVRLERLTCNLRLLTKSFPICPPLLMTIVLLIEIETPAFPEVDLRGPEFN